MNRVSRRSAKEAADALLEAGRNEPALHYDVELGLARHHDWLRSEAPMPEWASASAGLASRSFVGVAVKTLVSTVLVGTVAVAGWQARSWLQPSAAPVSAPSSVVESAQPAPPSPASDVETAQAPKPIPVPDHALPEVAAKRKPVRIERRAARPSQAAKELAAAHAVREEAPVAPLASVPNELDKAEPATDRGIAAAPAHLPSRAAPEARAEPERKAQAPDDLAEMQQVATAEQLLERSPARALALVRQGDKRFARGYFQQERAYIAIMALIKLGRLDEARAQAASFARQFPALPYGARIRSALDSQARGSRAHE